MSKTTAKTITINPLSQKSIENAITQINEYKAKIQEKETQLLSKLAELGCTRARIVFANFIRYDGNNDVTVDFNVDGTKATISAKGEAVAFIEFGAGVYYNGADSYPLPRPEGIVGIGQYGKGKGKQKAWGYYQDGIRDKKHLVITHGNPPAMGMYQAIVEISEEIGDIAKEVFRS